MQVSGGFGPLIHDRVGVVLVGRIRVEAMAVSQFDESLDLPALGALMMLSINVFLLVLVVLICANVALLMFARAAARESEIVVRNALGASRGRIVAQLFAEALVLGAVAAVIGVAAANTGLRWFYGAAGTIAAGCARSAGGAPRGPPAAGRPSARTTHPVRTR